MNPRENDEELRVGLILLEERRAEAVQRIAEYQRIVKAQYDRNAKLRHF